MAKEAARAANLLNVYTLSHSSDQVNGQMPLW
jgi:hypothetical protein